MTKTEIIVLIIVIFISVTLLSFFLDKIFKTKSNKQEKVEKKEEKQEKPKEVREIEKEEVSEKKEVKQEKNTPHISLALQDELNEFKDYLKARITPEIVSDEEKIKHSYDLPKVNRNFDDFRFSAFDEEDDEFPFRKKTKKESAYESLPDDVKILLFTDFFDTKF